MRVLDPRLDLEAFRARLRDAPSRVLLLDYDGTLAPFREERDEAVPYPGVREAVRPFVEEGHTRLVVVSGRAISHLLPLLGLEPAPEIRGSHGWEVRPEGGETELLDLPAGAEEGLREGRERAVRIGVRPGRVEEKPASLAFHTRGLPEDERAGAKRLRGEWEEVAAGSGLELHRFDGGVELRVPGRDKGTAVREILAGEPAGAVVAYLGDDLTDEDAFRVVNDLPGGLTALVRTELRETAARLWLRPPGELLEFLETWRREAWSG